MSSPIKATATCRAQARSTQPRQPGVLAGLVAATAILVGCTTQPAATASSATVTPSPAPASIVPVATAPPATPTTQPAAFPRNPAPIVKGVTYGQNIIPADFVAGVDHPFFPLTPGAKLVFEGDEHVEVTVLPETKLILGVAATVVRDQVFVDGVLEEDTIDWFAQDRDGNVWYFGEKTAELDKDGKVTSTAGSWEAGVDGAQPGIVMLAEPQVGDEYRQEFYAGEAEDLAAITAVTGSVTVGAGSWSGADVLVTEEWTPLEANFRERKTYARGAGLVKSERIVGGTEVITLEQITTAAAPVGPALLLGALLPALGLRRPRRAASVVISRLSRTPRMH